MNSLQGHLLIASPYMDDPRFARTVILVLRHDSQGAMGVILNRPIAGRLTKISTEVKAAVEGVSARVHSGGPVAGPLIALRPQTRGSRLSGEEQLATAALNQLLDGGDHEQLRVFVGHSGWQGGQLEAEVDAGDWLTLPATPDFVFGEDSELWVRAVRFSGQEFYREVLGIREFPDDATWN
jgi:putative transcriptional regulator